MAERATSVRWEPAQPTLGPENVILLARARQHSVKDYPGPLSIKTVLEGRVAWRLGKRDIWIDDSSFLVLNDGEPYSMEIDSPQPVTTFCVFFQRGFVESVYRDAVWSDQVLLDAPGLDPVPLEFVSTLHPREPKIVRCMETIRQQLVRGEARMGLEESYLRLATVLLTLHDEARKQISRLSAARFSTRKELYRRASMGREYLHAVAFQKNTLEEASRAACMSAFHFQRTFAAVFGKTPHQYVTELRLNRALLLLQSGYAVTEACFSVGFESLGSFSTKFRNYFGVTPASVRLHPTRERRRRAEDRVFGTEWA